MCMVCHVCECVLCACICVSVGCVCCAYGVCICTCVCCVRVRLPPSRPHLPSPWSPRPGPALCSGRPPASNPARRGGGLRCLCCDSVSESGAASPAWDATALSAPPCPLAGHGHREPGSAGAPPCAGAHRPRHLGPRPGGTRGW